MGDLNGDGKVTNADLQKSLLLLKNGQGSSSSVPEPASIALASLAGIALLAMGEIAAAELPIGVKVHLASAGRKEFEI